MFLQGEHPVQAVKAEDSRSRGRGFEYLRQILDGKLLQCNKKMEENKGSQMGQTVKKNILFFT